MKKKHTLIKLAAGAAISAGIIYFINRLINKKATEGHYLKSEPEDFYHWANGQVYLKKMGSGKPLLLIHDLNPMSSSKEWERCGAMLSENHTVYEIDLPGCGRSDKKKLPYVGFFYVQLLQSIFSNVIKEKADVVVSGASASLVLSALSYDRKMIDKVILVNPYALSGRGDSFTWRERIIKGLYELPLVGTLLYNIKMNRPSIDSVLSNELLYNPFNATYELVDSYYEAAHLGDSSGRYLMGAILAGYLNVNYEIAARRIENDTLIIFGESNTEKEDRAEEYLSYKNNIQLVSIEKSAFLPQLEEPEKFTEIVQKFLRGENVEE